VSSETLRSAIPSAQGRIRQHRLAEVLQIVIIMCAVEKNTTNLVTIRDWNVLRVPYPPGQPQAQRQLPTDLAMQLMHQLLATSVRVLQLV
jgi:hypothetical protein